MPRLRATQHPEQAVSPTNGEADSAVPVPSVRASGKARTEKARTQKLLNSQERALRAKFDPEFNTDSSIRTSLQHDPLSMERYSAHLQHWFFTTAFFDVNKREESYQHYGTFVKDRARCVYSLILALVGLLQRLFAQNEPELFHVLNTNVVDDTSTRIRGPHYQDPTTVYTIMNSVQTVHLRKSVDVTEDSGCCSSFRVPTPLTCLDQANTEGIHRAFAAGTLLTALGLGKMFQQFGLASDLVKSKFRTFILVGDALRANDAAFRSEIRDLIYAGRSNHLALRLRCSIHQLSLVRKPAVLFIPRLWATIVRLSHLFESLTFRKAFAKALASVIANSFIYLEVLELPAECQQWQALSDDLRNSFRCRSKVRKDQFNRMLDFLNGDLRMDSVVHYCVGRANGHCCEGPADALSKCLQLIVPFFSRGFPTPLLYRFKHYDEAVSYVTAGSSIHRLLIQALGTMGLVGTMDLEQHAVVEKLLGNLDLQKDGLDDTDAAIFIDEGLDCESFHSQNAKRKQLVHQEITKPGFVQSTVMVDFIIKPIDGMINRLFRRSSRLSKMTLLGNLYCDWDMDLAKSKELFLDIALGRFGWACVQEYCQLLIVGLGPVTRMGLAQDQLKTFLALTLHMVSDTWRRFVHDYCVYPFQLFELMDQSLEQFVTLWDGFVAASEQCPQCFDPCFSTRLLGAFGSLGMKPMALQQQAFAEVSAILQDICAFAPVSSDAVEVKNGQVQSIVSRRGNMAVKGPESSREASFLQSCIRDFELVKHFVEEQTLPPKTSVSGILRMAGTSSSNQHSTSKAPWFCVVPW